MKVLINKMLDKMLSPVSTTAGRRTAAHQHHERALHAGLVLVAKALLLCACHRRNVREAIDVAYAQAIHAMSFLLARRVVALKEYVTQMRRATRTRDLDTAATRFKLLEVWLTF